MSFDILLSAISTYADNFCSWWARCILSRACYLIMSDAVRLYILLCRVKSERSYYRQAQGGFWRLTHYLRYQSKVSYAYIFCVWSCISISKRYDYALIGDEVIRIFQNYAPTLTVKLCVLFDAGIFCRFLFRVFLKKSDFFVTYFSLTRLAL